jgi:hypothetical protein
VEEIEIVDRLQEGKVGAPHDAGESRLLPLSNVLRDE